MTGPLAVHMAVHILLMNIVAPLTGLGLSRVLQNSRAISGRLLGLATLVQIAGLWAWHAPPFLYRALESSSVHLLMNGSLFLSAFLFWWAVLHFRGERSWQPVAALLVTVSSIACSPYSSSLRRAHFTPTSRVPIWGMASAARAPVWPINNWRG